MLLACSWSVLSFGPWACWPFASTQGRIRCPTLAPRAPSRDRGQKGKGLQLSRAAAQAITVVILWLTQHFGANPPTSRKCYRSTATIRMILSMLLVSFFLPIEILAECLASVISDHTQCLLPPPAASKDKDHAEEASVAALCDNPVGPTRRPVPRSPTYTRFH